MTAKTTYACDKCGRTIGVFQTSEGWTVKVEGEQMLVTYNLDDAMLGPPRQLHFHYACLTSVNREAAS